MYRIGRTLSLFAVVALAAVGLSGCSSSGGDGGGGSSLSETRLYGDLDAYGKLAANNPNFGSVTQSSNGVGGTTTDSVETMFEDGELTVIVNGGDGNERFQLNSDENLYKNGNLRGSAWLRDDEDSASEGQSVNGWVLWKEEENDEDGGVVALVYTSWADADPTNYLAGGYWIRYDGDGVQEIGTFGDAGSGSVFGYVDAGTQWTAPATGSATYLGEAEGAYVYDDEGGVWWSRMMLEADFGTSKINGCVGCEDVGMIYSYSSLADLRKDDGTPEDVYLKLLETDIENGGTFRGALTVYDRSTGEQYGDGKWGGLFSQNVAATDTPDQVAGTLGGTFDDDDDGEDDGGFVGVFHGVKEQTTQ